MKKYLCFLLLFAPYLGMAQYADRAQGLPTDYPVPPKTANRLFYLQRNLNENTVVYDLKFSSNGQVDTREPLDVYYIRYALDGKPAGLKWIERKMAYGYSSEHQGDGVFEVELIAYPDRKIEVKKQKGRYRALMQIAGRQAELTHIYVYDDESGLLPKVQYVDIYGKDATTGQELYERIRV